jgi:hypothetical protein
VWALLTGFTKASNVLGVVCQPSASVAAEKCCIKFTVQLLADSFMNNAVSPASQKLLDSDLRFPTQMSNVVLLLLLQAKRRPATLPGSLRTAPPRQSVLPTVAAKKAPEPE